jgi:crotonobetainyl-CoA:carnitine CoA-transferase CaiB-like acyl-CoA transferase
VTSAQPNRLLADFCRTTGLDPAPVEIGELDTLPSRLATTELSTGSVAAASLAAACLTAERGHGTVPAVHIDPRRVAASFTNDRLQRLDGAGAVTWAELSGFWAAADGWVRTHANYPHHRERLLAALGLAAETGRDAFAARVGALPRNELEDRVTAAGGIAAAVREAGEWRRHPQAVAVAALPLVGLTRVAGAPPRRLGPAPAGPLRPATGLRVLDLTRVIAGPVATRTLALLGADVLRVDSPALPEIEWQHLDTGAGKRSTRLDLRSHAGRATLDELLTTADVVVTGYRPGALDGFGLDPAALAARRPGLVVASLSAWGETGPWRERRGFDSIVQAATGIALRESADGATPGALPAQALDHATGHLLAAAVLTAVTRQLTGGGTWHVRAHLARTAHWLLEAPAQPGADGTWDPDDVLTEHDTASGRLRAAPPAVSFDGGPVEYPNPGGVWGADAASWA